MLEKEDLLKVRDTYTELIKKELLGPGSEISIPDEEHELISTRPEGRYSIGILYPHGEKLSVDNEDVSYFLSNSLDNEGLVRESEYKGKIRLGQCEKCDKTTSCNCCYHE